DVANTIVADASPGGECASAGFLVDNGHNLDAGTTCGLGGPAVVDLGPLQHNSPGPSYILTRALGPQSEAIDAADDSLAPKTDARGVKRPKGPHSDNGAYGLIP